MHGHPCGHLMILPFDLVLRSAYATALHIGHSGATATNRPDLRFAAAAFLDGVDDSPGGRATDAVAEVSAHILV